MSARPEPVEPVEPDDRHDPPLPDHVIDRVAALFVREIEARAEREAPP